MGAAHHAVTSPDGAVIVDVSDDGGVSYRVSVDGREILSRSKLGLEFAGGVVLGPNTRIAKEQRASRDGKWENRFGKRRDVRDQYNELRLTLNEPGAEHRVSGLVVRAYDNGVAFRYDLPEESGLGRFTLNRELTEFAFAGDYTCWAGEPSPCAESRYLESKLSGIPVDEKAPWRSVLPLLVKTPVCLVAVAESDLRDWAGMFLVGTKSSRVAAALAPRSVGEGAVVSSVPRLSPWRVLMIGRRASDLIGSDLVATLATPNRLGDVSWVKPGLCAWDAWWVGINPYLPQYREVWSRGDTRSHKEYIDFAAKMGWPYQLVDWFWYKNMSSYSNALNHGESNPAKPVIDFTQSEPHIDLPALFAHAREKGVRLIIWMHSDDINTYGIDKAFDLLARWGAAGAKIDFLNSDSQETVAWCERVLKAAAKRKLMVDFHGTYKPTGLARTYPNFITQEGVLGNEYNKLDGAKCAPLHTITLPFTRGLLGPMDFTPGGFLNRTVKDFRITAPAEVMGTRARQLAMPVIYESPLTVLCDSPAHYRNQPGIEFYRGLPTVWDDTVVLSAEVARHIVIARRSGQRWYLAAMNGEDPVSLKTSLSFLGKGPWTLRQFADTPDSAAEAELLAETTRRVVSSDFLDLSLAPAGGFAAVLSPQ